MKVRVHQPLRLHGARWWLIKRWEFYECRSKPLDTCSGRGRPPRDNNITTEIRQRAKTANFIASYNIIYGIYTRALV